MIFFSYPVPVSGMVEVELVLLVLLTRIVSGFQGLRASHHAQQTGHHLYDERNRKKRRGVAFGGGAPGDIQTVRRAVRVRVI